jgi:hypothetical protein
MPMPPYPVTCVRPGCGQPAVFKVAAEWSDGATREFKTYALCCPACLPDQFRDAKRRHAACRTAPGETLLVPGVYELVRGARDTKLVRRAELE